VYSIVKLTGNYSNKGRFCNRWRC